jgi:1-acyl-sn-glycerol-3-phosphate acyltransferase
MVANHQNSLLDPVLVVAAARRPVRFLAKAPLFTDRAIGWLVRAAGAIPVYRRVDDPGQMSRNVDTFRAVHDALATGAAVGIFPEGTSHSEPSLVPIKTGAARIALGGYALTGKAFPIVPVGLVFRQKDVFRSDAIVFTGPPVPWADLAERQAGGQRTEANRTADDFDPETVRELTDRIAASLRQVTLNLERWEDRPLVECAIRIWEAERHAPPLPAERVARLDVTTRILAEVRRKGDAAAIALAREVDAHCRRLRRLRLRPADLVADVGLTRGVWWTARRAPVLVPLAATVALTSAVLFWPSYRVTSWFVGRLNLLEDVRSTWKLIAGLVFHSLWVVLLTTVVGLKFGALPALLVLLGMPSLGIGGLLVRERWRWAWGDARRFFLLRSRRELVQTLRERQRELGAKMDALFSETVRRRDA